MTSRPPLVTSFAEDGATDVLLVGGKFCGLVAAHKHGFRVPPGFAVTTEAFQLFLRHNHLEEEVGAIWQQVQGEGTSPQEASGVLQRLLCAAVVPPEVKECLALRLRELGGEAFAVRSSAPFEDGPSNSWAGKFDSFLDIPPELVEEHVLRCWMSLFGTAAIEYGLRLHGTLLSMGVVVQKFIRGSFSGVAFSVDPATSDHDVVVVETVRGPGAALVGGRVTPGTYLVDKSTRRILTTLPHPASGGFDSSHLAPVLVVDAAVAAIVEMEARLGYPSEIEWTSDAQGLHILQSRPITTLQRSEVPAPTGLLRGRHGFEKIYASKGIPFLYEDMICCNYLSWETVVVCRSGGDQVFGSTTDLDRAAEEFREAGVALLEEARRGVQEVEARILSSDPASGTRFHLFGELLRHYGRFDANVWSRCTNDESGAWQFVVREKNVLRATVDRLFFEQECPFGSALKAVASLRGVKAEDLLWYRQAEILRLLHEEQSIPEVVVADRSLCSVWHRMTGGAVRLWFGPAANEFCDAFVGAGETDADMLRGTPTLVEGRLVRGIVVVVRRDYSNPGDVARIGGSFPSGAVLVTESADPSLDPIIARACAVVTELGGTLSHAAISAREYRVPCVVGVTGAASRLRDGDIVTIDLTSGEIHVSKEA